MKKLIILTAISLAAISCNQEAKENKGKKDKADSKLVRMLDSASSLQNYDLAAERSDRIYLPNELKEISGIAVNSNGRLFAHNDESSMIYEIDMSSGSIIKRFSAGKPARKDDFEDIEIVNGRFYLVNNKGDLLSFNEETDGAYAEIEILKTPLSHSYDVEGLCYDPETNSLLLACKGFSGDQAYDGKSVFTFSLSEKKMSDKARFRIAREKTGKGFAPSGISRNPVTGSFYVISAAGNSVAEVSKDGTILGTAVLSPRVHEQPEGIAFLPDGTLLIANEGKSGKGYMLIYKPKK